MRGGFTQIRGQAPAITAAVLGILLMAIAWGCSGWDTTAIVDVDGSSTVFLVTEAMAEEFQKKNSDVRVTVGISGTGGGFTKFCNGEIQIADASRPIKPVEMEACARNGVGYIELPVAFDGLSVVVNPDNDWVDHLTVEELKEIWRPGSTVEKWSDVRSGWPDKDLFLVGADTDSGTFDYFTKVIVGEEGASRPDYTASADDNVLVQAIAGEERALGYFGYAYYVENRDRLKVVLVDSGTGPVAPSMESINNNAYAPLSRPLFIYVNRQDAERSDVERFVGFYLGSENANLVAEVGYVPFPESIYQLVRSRFEDRVTGSVFGGEGSQVGVSIENVLRGR